MSKVLFGSVAEASRWELIADRVKTPGKYIRLKNEIEANGEMLYKYGPASVYGESAEVYRFNNKLYKILWDMYGARQVEELQGACIRTSAGKTLWARREDEENVENGQDNQDVCKCIVYWEEPIEDSQKEEEAGIPVITNTTQFIVGYKVWQLDGNSLISTAMDYEWRKGENIATHSDDDIYHHPLGENVPVLQCLCGFYAMKSPEELKGFLTEGSSHIMGRVALYGKVIECELGYRAEKAQIMGLFNTCPEALTVTEEYDVELLPNTVCQLDEEEEDWISIYQEDPSHWDATISGRSVFPELGNSSGKEVFHELRGSPGRSLFPELHGRI